MPTYEYKCNKCKKQFDIFQKITDKPIKKCPECSGALERLISKTGALIFKGSGFYATDYRSKSYKEAKKKEQPGGNVCPKTGEKADCSACSP